MRIYLSTKQSNEVHRTLGSEAFLNGTFETRRKILHSILTEYFKVGKKDLPMLRDCDLRTIVYSMMSMRTLREALDFNFQCYAEEMKEEEKNSLNWTAEERAAYSYVSREYADKLKKQGIF